MRIAIAEDETVFANRLQEYLTRFSSEHAVPFDVDTFPNGADLVNAYRHARRWDLILLDVDMPNLDGLSAARCIREKDPDVLIIFITNLAQYAIKGYEVDALDYVLKPVSYSALAMKLDKAVRLARRNNERALLLSMDRETVRVPLSHLYYVEVYDHRLIYHTADGEIRSTGAKSLRAVEEELSPEGFARCHSAYLVNLRYVDAIQGNSVLVMGQELPIARNRRRDFLQALLEHEKG